MPHRLLAAVLPPVSVPPPGVDAGAWRDALLADAEEVVDDLHGVTLLPAGDGLAATLDLLAAAGATIGVVLAGDAPDLPGLLVGKLFSACEDRAVGVLPAAGGGLVGLAARLPAPGWLGAVGLDTPDALDRLHAAAPVGEVVVGPGWHRLREPGDVAALDPGLEGWEATRALLSGR